jgi:peptidyl-prolyl cis-trans isomerase C
MAEESKKKSNAGVFGAVAVLVVLAIAVLVYLSGNMKQLPGNGEMASESSKTEQVAAKDGNDEEAREEEAEEIKLEPGNPVVAVVNGEEISRSEVFKFIAGLPQNVRQMPVGQLFDLAIEQLVNARLLEDKASKVDLSTDEKVKEQLEKARKQIERNIFLQRQVEEKLTEERLKELYNAYVEGVGDVMETKASHILVESESEAGKIIKKLEGGADFTELAKKTSTGPSAEKGGDLGWFAKGEMVPEFSEAAFSMEPGEISDKPVKTQFGWHVIKVEDRRKRETPTFEEIKPILEPQLRRQILDNLIKKWREEAEVEVYSINGKKAAGEGQDETSEEDEKQAEE